MLNTPTADFYFQDLKQSIATALAEDIGLGDLTAELIPKNKQAIASVICRDKAVICGRPWFDGVFQAIDPSLSIKWLCQEGETVAKNTLICEITGKAAAILTAERTALNFLQTLSGTATITQEYVSVMGNCYTRLLDTRKTLPGLRLAQKYAVACGGGTNHRIGLYDAILIKENHIISVGGIAKAVALAKTLHPNIKVEVETENLDEVHLALEAQADIIMLDNFSLSMIHGAVLLNKQHLHTAKLEASGNVEIKNLPSLINTEVDFISTGAITKHLKATDFSMRFNFKEEPNTRIPT